jgi:uncharacterized membrane protein (UPF0127 family)
MPSFVTAFLRDSTSVWALVNVDSGADLAARVAVAGDSASRRRGLLGRDRLDNEALVIAPCAAVHTCFMRDVRPWRIAAALRAFATIEMAAGTIARTGTTRGHRVALRPASS